MTFGQYIKQYRFEHGMSLRDFSERSGISFSQLSAFENGKVNAPSFKTIAAIAAAMGMSVREIQKKCSDITMVAPNNGKQMTEREEIAEILEGLSDERVHAVLELLKLM